MSKATTALLRLREIDTKYKSRLSGNYKFVRESSSDGSSSDNESREILRPRLNIQMPETYVEFLGNYSSDNEQKLLSPVEIIPRAVESSEDHDSGSGEFEKRVIELKKEHSEDTGEEILEQSVCEVLQEFSESNEEINRRSSIEAESIISKEKIIDFREFLENYSNATEEVNESLSHKVDTIATTEEKLLSESSESQDERAIESYSQEPFESNVSSSDENESDGKETFASGTSDYLSPVLEIYEEGSRVMEIIPGKSAIISNNFQEQSTFRNHEIENQDKILSETNDIIDNQSSGVNNQPINMRLDSNTNVDEELNAKFPDGEIDTESFVEKIGNVKTRVTDELNERNASQLSSKSEQSISHRDGGDFAVVTTKGRNECVKGANKEICQDIGRTHSIRREHKHVSSSIKQYLRRLDEENSHHRVFPNRLVFPETPYLSVIRPLQFPKVPEIFLAGNRQDHDPDIAFLRSRLIDIRQWLKDQYTIYKEHCDLAKSINRNYQPADPMYTKKTSIRRQGVE